MISRLRLLNWCREIKVKEDTFKLQKGLLGKEMGYEISTCQMQYVAADRKMDKKTHVSYTLEATILRKAECTKYSGVTIAMISKGGLHI